MWWGGGGSGGVGGCGGVVVVVGVQRCTIDAAVTDVFGSCRHTFLYLVQKINILSCIASQAAVQ